MAGRGASAGRRPQFKKLVTQQMREIDALRQMDMYRAALQEKMTQSAASNNNNNKGDDDNNNNNNNKSSDSVGASGRGDGGGGVSTNSSVGTPSSPSKRRTSTSLAFLKLVLSPPPKGSSQMSADDVSRDAPSRASIRQDHDSIQFTSIKRRPSDTRSSSPNKASSLDAAAAAASIVGSSSMSPRAASKRLLTPRMETKSIVEGSSTKSHASSKLASAAAMITRMNLSVPAPPLTMESDHDKNDDRTSDGGRIVAQDHGYSNNNNHENKDESLSSDAGGFGNIRRPDVPSVNSNSNYTSSENTDGKDPNLHGKKGQQIRGGNWVDSNMESKTRHLDSRSNYHGRTHDDDGSDNRMNGIMKMKDQPRSSQRMNCCRCIFYNLNNFRKACGALVNNEQVQFAIIMLIVVNSIMMGIGTSDFVDNNYEVNRAFEISDTVFLIIFSVELAFQMVYRGLYVFMDGWLFFDFSIVVMSWSLENFQIVRAFRVFRAFRLVTRLQVLKNLVTALFSVAPSMAAIIALLLLIIYIYSVLCTVLFQDLYAEGYLDVNYFGTLDASLFTMFQMMTLDWSYIARQVMVKYNWAWGIFTSFLIMTSFILYSLIIAVVCDAVAVSEHSEEDEAQMDGQVNNTERIAKLQKRVYELGNAQERIMESMKEVMALLQEVDDDDDSADEH